ncbi:hypothetical protein TKK_0003339 [Trichogramma kaykai]
MTRVKFINQKRSTLKGQITQLEKILSDPLDSPEKIASVKGRKVRLEKLFETYVELNDELALLVPADDENLIDFLTVEERYFDVVGRCDALNSSTNDNAMNTTSIVAGNNTHRLKLPVADLPKFDGDISNWLSFKNTFMTMVGDSDIPKLQKFMYLQNCLVGDALRKISIYNVSEENFDHAWKLLLESYDKKRILMAKHLDAILTLEPVAEATHPN